MPKETIVISLGGSLIVPDGIDAGFLKKFRSLIEKEVKRGQRFVIVAGGGKTARTYQAAAPKTGRVEKEDLDWLGVHATRINGHLLRTIFRAHAHPVLWTNIQKFTKVTKPVVIAAGWKPGNPGWSTDYVAVKLAEKIGVKKVLNLSNIDYVYDKDPRKFKSAKPFKEISWKKFRSLTPQTWKPGINSPLDPTASKEAEKVGMTVTILNGKKLSELEKYLNKKPFRGTTIS